MTISPATAADSRQELAALYAACWQTAYRGLLPQPYLDGLTAAHWAGSLDAPGLHHLLLRDGRQLVGTAAYCPARANEMAGWGELVSLYLLAPHRGQGLGKQLLEAALGGLRDLGFARAYLWVLSTNLPARRFYARQGFAPTGAALDEEIGGWPVREIQYARHLL